MNLCIFSNYIRLAVCQLELESRCNITVMQRLYAIYNTFFGENVF